MLHLLCLPGMRGCSHRAATPLCRAQDPSSAVLKHAPRCSHTVHARQSLHLLAHAADAVAAVGPMACVSSLLSWLSLAPHAVPHCHRLPMQARSLRRAQDVRKQLVAIMDRYKLDLVSGGCSCNHIAGCSEG